MTQTIAQIINHTHWDREWFLTSVYTTAWIPGLIDKLEQLVAENPDYRFLLDGQTLVIEDLLHFAPEYGEKVSRLIKNGNLIIGPYYAQPDWLLTGGEALVRNLLYGWQDVRQHGGAGCTGWLVDTFGHISQAPQLHGMFGIEAVYVWRGVPQMEPYFNWEGSDGQQLFTINLFSGYRNLYGVTHTPEIAVRRLQAEVDKLRPYYPTADIPLFDGYDLEDNPEDPTRFYQGRLADISPDLQIKESTAEDFAATIRRQLQALPTIRGELNSGKYGATFPGTFSARTYLKIMSWDCDHLLFEVCEPLAVLARLRGRAYNGQQYQAWGRALLQNAVHDCICGVSIDQVHEKMAYSYRKTFEGIKADLGESLAYVLQDFAAGTYAVSTNPFVYDGWQMAGDQYTHTQTDGIGVWPVEDAIPVETPEKSVEDFTWQNSHYTARVGADGKVQIGEATLGFLTVSAEEGDTYSDERGARQEACRLQSAPVIEQKSDRHCALRYECALSWEDIQVAATVRLIFDQSPLVRWQVDLDSRGTDFQVDMVFETACRGQVRAGMPFDVVARPVADRDLLPRDLDKRLADVLLGQRELEVVNTFPFQGFVVVSDRDASTAILAKGARAYQADEGGRVALTLRRAVEWLTRPGLKTRIGDAGPLFYVPDARCERLVRHELAVAIGDFGADDLALHQLNAGFQNPPLIVEARGDGARTTWQCLQQNAPLSSLHLYDDKILARFFNPTANTLAFDHPFSETDVWGHVGVEINMILPKGIVTVAVEAALPPTSALSGEQGITFVDGPTWRVGHNQGLPAPKIIAQLQTRISELERQLAQTQEQLDAESAAGASVAGASVAERYILQHRVYVLQREIHEYRLSARLNEVKLAMGGGLSEAYLYEPDQQVAEIGLQLNQLRIKRRIYDYVVQVATQDSP